MGGYEFKVFYGIFLEFLVKGKRSMESIQDLAAKEIEIPIISGIRVSTIPAGKRGRKWISTMMSRLKNIDMDEIRSEEF